LTSSYKKGPSKTQKAKKKERGRKGKEIIKKKSWRKVVSSPFQEEEEATSLTKENKEGV
jgi:hypothetical protein